MTIETGGTALGPYDFVIGLVGDQVVIGGTPEEAWPFKESRPSTPVADFEGTLNKPEKGAALLIFKYTIAVAGRKAADPVIIVDH